MRQFTEETKTRYIESYFGGTPTLKNEYGSLNNLLSVVLTKPYNIQTVLGVTLDVNTINFQMNAGHGYYPEQVIQLTGSDEVEFQREYRVVTSGPESITVKNTTKLLTPPTGTVQLQGAPLGYELIYENTKKGIMCFKNKSTISPGILKVIDILPPNGYEESWSKYARVVMGVSIDLEGDFIDNFKAPYNGQFPNAEKTGNDILGAEGIHGFAKWVYSSQLGGDTQESVAPAPDYQGSWSIVGDDKTFYLMINPSGAPGNPEHGCDLVGFGTFKSYNPLETLNICLQAKDGFIPANDNIIKSPSRSRSFFGAYVSEYSGFLLADIYRNNRTGLNRSTTVGNYMSNRYTTTPWRDGNLKAYDTSLKIMKSEMLIKDHNNFIRGEHRGIYGLYGFLQQEDTSVSSDGYLVKHVENPVNSTTFAKAPILFSLRDWEYV